MNKQWLLAALAMAGGGCAQAQDMYAGTGFPGLVTVGYAHAIAPGWGLRGEYGGGLSVSKNEVQQGVNVTGSIKANRIGAFADWFPSSGGFRLVGGVTANDIKSHLNGVGTNHSTINGKTVDLTGETYTVALKFPSVTPYLGIGYGHHHVDKGMGFYADVGAMFGTFKVDVTTSVVGKQGITQADVDAQAQKVRDSVSRVPVLPSVAMGLVYRF